MLHASAPVPSIVRAMAGRTEYARTSRFTNACSGSFRLLRPLRLWFILICLWSPGCDLLPWFSPAAEDKTVGLIQLIEFNDIQGLRNWAYELDQRRMKALIFLQKDILEGYPDDVRCLSDRGHEIAGGYAKGAFWDVDYQTQYDAMKATKDLVEQITGRPMRVFGAKYFSYDETTLKAAQDLGVQYILGRGTSDVEAIIYAPEEYNVKIISISNVPFPGMGRGSLCDYSLWARGSTAAEFSQTLQEAVAKQPKRMVITSHAYIGGMKKAWWEAYKRVLDSQNIAWAENFDEWANSRSGVNISVPLSMIPVDREVKYETPHPTEPLDTLENVVQNHSPCGTP